VAKGGGVQERTRCTGQVLQTSFAARTNGQGRRGRHRGVVHRGLQKRQRTKL